MSSLDPNNLFAARKRMVDRDLAARGLHDPRVLAAMNTVPREEFVSPALRPSAYDDSPLPIGRGQTISQPFTVAFMAQALALTGCEHVLEIGTGSGYGAAVLSQLASSVVTVERHADLAASAVERLAKLGYHNVEVVVDDGSLGAPRQAPFDGIVVTAGAGSLPRPLSEQLGEGGRLVIPIGPTRHEQRLLKYTRRGAELTAEDFGAFAFVPLIGVEGWPERT